MSNFQKNSKDYGEPNITYQLAALSNANHDGMSHVISWESSLLIISYKTIFLRFGGFMNQLLYIVWNPDLVAFRLGPLSVRWYGLMWAIGIALAFLVVKRL